MATISTGQQTAIANLYVALFNRAPDVTGFGFWVQALSNGSSLSTITQGFLSSPESKAIYPSSQTSEQFITTFYTTVFGRAPDAAGLAFWAGVVNANGGSSSDAAKAVAVSQIIAVVSTPLTTKPADLTDAQYAETVKDRATFANKVDVSVYFAVEAKASNLDLAKQVLSTVTDTAASVEAAKAAALGGAAGGTTFVLTDSTDVLVGTSGNDTFIAGLKGAAATLTAGDSITGGSGIDRLNTFDNLNAAAFATANITGVELVYSQLAAGALNVSANAGVTQAWIAGGSTGVNTVTLTKAQTAGVQGVQGAATSVFAFSDVAGAADSATLALNAATGLTGLTIAGVETLTVNATGTSNIGTLTAAATTTLNVTGTGKFTAVAAGGTFKTVDASANTGGVTLDISALAGADIKVTGSAAADEVTIAYANLTKADVIDLGAGTDTLAFSDATTIDATQIGKYAGIKNVETFKFIGTATVDAAVTDIASFAIGAGAVTFTNLANADAISIGAVAAAANTFGVQLGQNTLNLTLAGSATVASDASAIQTVTGSSTVNVISNGTAPALVNKLTLTTADNNLINVSGAKDLTLVVNAAGNVTGHKIDASTFTGKLTVTGSGAGDIIIGGAGDDVISGGAGAAIGDTLTGGAGKDKFIIISGATAAAADTITDFATTVDTIAFGATAATATNFTKATAVATDFAAALAAANLVLTATGGIANAQYNVQQVGADTFVFYNDGTATGADSIVKLAGVALAGVVFGDVVAV